MTTVVDPLGTPIPVYNRSGTAIVSLTASGTWPSGPSGVPNITRVSGVTVAVVTVPDSSNNCVALPSGSEIGDVVEIYFVGGRGDIVSQTGETINGTQAGGTFGAMGSGRVGCYLRKVSSTGWGAAVEAL